MGNCTCNRQDGSRSRLLATSSRRNIEAPGFDVQARVSCTCAREALRAAGASQCEGYKSHRDDSYATAGTKWLPFRGSAGGDSSTDDTDLYLEGLTDVGADAWHNPLVKVGTVTCKKGHPLVKLGPSKENGWVCHGRDEPGGCRSDIIDFQQSDGVARYRCETCNYDLCEECYRFLEESRFPPAEDVEDECAELDDPVNAADVKIISGKTCSEKLDNDDIVKCNDFAATDAVGMRRSVLNEKVKAVRISKEAADCSSLASVSADTGSQQVDYYSSEPDEDSGSDIETEQEPMEMFRKRKGGILAAPIEKGKFEPPQHKKEPAIELKMKKALVECILFKSLSPGETSDIVSTMPVINKKKGENIFLQGEIGDALFVVLSGTVDCYREAHVARAHKDTDHLEDFQSYNTVVSGKQMVSTTTWSMGPASTVQASTMLSKDTKQNHRTFIVTREDGAIFGELSIIFNTPRSLSVYAREAVTLGKLEGQVYQNLVVRRQMAVREKLEDCLRKAKILETLGDEQIAKLADALELQVIKKDKPIIRQGDEGKELFIVQSGNCVATIKTCDDEQEHCRYGPGDSFGELALLNKKPRAATITAVTRVEVFKLSRRKFERMLGSMSMLHQQSYKTDPRKLIADFYRPGDERGPKGTFELHVASKEGDEASEGKSQSAWFAVFRPTSRDAVAKMLSGNGVGKGLNVKGKSAKKNRLSGFVPYVQISDNAHKKEVEKMPKGSRVRVFYRTQAARETAQAAVVQFVAKRQEQESKRRLWKKQNSESFDAAGNSIPGKGSWSSDGSRRASEMTRVCSIAERDMKPTLSASRTTSPADLFLKKQGTTAFQETLFDTDDQFAPAVFGLTLAGPLLHSLYLLTPDLSPSVEWETGRKSEPAYMNMNMHAVCSNTKPEIVLYQHDEADPMNPRGLLIAYAEKTVKPVVSDFDAFLVASKRMRYLPLPDSQADLVKWCLKRVEGVLASPGGDSWTTRWLGVLKEETDKGFHPEIPEFGFGDPTSIRLISDVVSHTSACGAVRHGAECFNYYFPQELDEDYLVVWEGFPSKPWEYLSEKELRVFLLERVADGFRFPVNPVWPVRDPGWYEVLEALKESTTKFGDREDTLDAWYPPGSGILEHIERMHQAYPRGFGFRRSICLNTHKPADGGNSGVKHHSTCASIDEHVEMSLHQLRRKDTKGKSYRGTLFGTTQTMTHSIKGLFSGGKRTNGKTVANAPDAKSKKKRFAFF